LYLPVVTIVDAGYEGFEFFSIQGFLTKVDDVNSHIVLLQLLAQLDQRFIIFFNGTSHKYDDPLALIFVLAML
jgi:hypothetical protein